VEVVLELEDADGESGAGVDESTHREVAQRT
jgi:hypothetical protein